MTTTVKLTATEEKALAQLRAEAEGVNGEWQQVYLDNARGDIPAKTFRSILGSLAKKGLYRPQHDDFFGDVRMY